MSLSSSAFAGKLNAVECAKLNDLIEMQSQSAWQSIGVSEGMLTSPRMSRGEISRFSDEDLKAHGMSSEQIAELKEKFQPKHVELSDAEVALKKAEAELRLEEEAKWERKRQEQDKKWEEENKIRQATEARQKKELTAVFQQNDCAKHLKSYYSLPIIQELKKQWEDNRKNDEKDE